MINTLGPVELWALSTSAEDVDLRSRLYEVLLARLRLAAFLRVFSPVVLPVREIRRRVVQRSEKVSGEAASTAAIILEMTEELIRVSRETKTND